MILFTIFRHTVRKQSIQKTFIRRSSKQLQSADQTRAKSFGELDSMDRSEAHATYRNGDYKIYFLTQYFDVLLMYMYNYYYMSYRLSSVSFYVLQNLKSQVMTTSVWLVQKWFDCNLKWNPKDYGGLEVLYVPSDHIWLPDIVLFNK